jgi:hypothetical protein
VHVGMGLAQWDQESRTKRVLVRRARAVSKSRLEGGDAVGSPTRLTLEGTRARPDTADSASSVGLTATRSCPACGMEFRARPKAFANGRPQRYCAPTCRPSHRRLGPRLAVCGHCGAEFAAGGRGMRRKYCSKACGIGAFWAGPGGERRREKLRAAYRAANPLGPTTCGECGAVFAPTYKRKYCSTRCRDRLHSRRKEQARAAKVPCSSCGGPRRTDNSTGQCGPCTHPYKPTPCVGCGALLSRKGKGQIVKRCPACASLHREAEASRFAANRVAREAALAADRQLRREEWSAPKPCAWCLKPFVATTGTQKYCCNAHNDIAKSVRRKRRLRGAPRNLPLPSLWEIYERDRGLCRLCALPVDQSLRWPNQGTASIDHIVPVSRGGSESGENYQLAHLRCNQARQAKPIEEWLRAKRAEIENELQRNLWTLYLASCETVQ